jgi:diguanylate cyclase (GGDEF)-like protein
VDTAEATALLVGLLVVVTCGLCYRLYRAIHIPLGALAVRAHQITQGQLELGDEAGTREITTVARALNEAISNLTQLKTQAEALAGGDLAHPSLAQAAPGRLGQSFYQSVIRVADLQQQLQNQASHDPLTGLLNRRAVIDQLDKALVLAADRSEAIGVLFIDLDGFKLVNDTNGHNVGDHVLRVIAQRLTGTAGATDIVCRLGGDEFIVNVANPRNVNALLDLGQRLITAIVEPITAGTTTHVQVGASVGISLTDPSFSCNGAELIAEADIAVYAAKGRGPGQIHYYRDVPTTTDDTGTSSAHTRRAGSRHAVL